MAKPNKSRAERARRRRERQKLAQQEPTTPQADDGSPASTEPTSGPTTVESEGGSLSGQNHADGMGSTTAQQGGGGDALPDKAESKLLLRALAGGWAMPEGAQARAMAAVTSIMENEKLGARERLRAVEVLIKVTALNVAANKHDLHFLLTRRRLFDPPPGEPPKPIDSDSAEVPAAAGQVLIMLPDNGRGDAPSSD